MTSGNDRLFPSGALPHWGIALALCLSGLSHIRAQEPKGFSSIPVNLDAASRNAFWIDANETITFSLPSNRGDLRLVFKNPNGLVWEIAAPTSAAARVSPQTVYGTTIDRPAVGEWTLAVASADPILGHPSANLHITYANSVRARLLIPKQTFVSGESLPVSLELMDGSVRVKNIQTTVTVTKLEDPAISPALVVFLDDGSHGDRIANDGMYTATIPTEAPGMFHLEAQVEGTASTGHCHRSFSLTFKVVTKAARITGNINQRTLVGTPN